MEIKGYILLLKTSVIIYGENNMKISKYIPFIAVISLAVLSGCQEATSSSLISQVENSSLISNQKLNSAIEDYVDKYLSEIIRIRNFNRERVNKVFCAHHTGYVESVEKAPNSLHVYVKLLCVEAIPAKIVTLPITSGTLIGNPMSIISKIDVDRLMKSSVDKKAQESFHISSDDTTRDTPYYLEDLRRILNNDMIDRMQKIQPNQKADYLLLEKKASKYQKQQSQNCK
jgi:hypothetical protein